MFVYLSLSDLSGVRNQDGGEPLLTGGRLSSEVASVQRKTAAACSPAGQRRSVVVGAGPDWALCRLGSTADPSEDFLSPMLSPFAIS